jgi:hypothetical protein
MKTFKLGILALVLGLFTLTSCEKEELESDYPSTLSGSETGGTTEPTDTVALIDSLINVWTLEGSARLNNGGMGDINFLVSSSGELDSLTFGNTWVNDYFVEDGSFEYLGDGKFIFKYDQIRETVAESFIDTVTMSQSVDYSDYIEVQWKNFTDLTPKTYFYTYVD